MDMALDLIINTSANIFLSGKAGTGKSTFIKNLREKTSKQTILVAPSGVAAVNIGGVTIHSFFQLPHGPFIPRITRLNNQKIKENKQEVMKEMDLLIIDEISMVRADLLDAIDAVLRRIRKNEIPFGGVQLLLVGDMHQLPPVTTAKDKELLDGIYDTDYFFGSYALKKAGFFTVQLEHIYRQDDMHFKELLNKVRIGNNSWQIMRELNSRYVENFNPDDSEGYIRLMTHAETQAEKYNEERINALDGTGKTYVAEIQGTYQDNLCPTKKELLLKVGARVMFIKNDFQQGIYNGMLGTVTKLCESSIEVKPDGHDSSLEIEYSEWENIEYEIDHKTNDVIEKVIGFFRQIPVRLAWAITIHKSQGLTFDHVILDLHRCFSHGQAYVALSRCRSLQGIILSHYVGKKAIRCDQRVATFMNEPEHALPSEEQIQKMKEEYKRTVPKSDQHLDNNVRLRNKKLFVTDNPQELDKTFLEQFSDQSEPLTIVVPDSFNCIGEQAFSYCDKLSSVVIPDTIKEIKRYAFLNCTNLTSVELPGSIMTIEEGVFNGCEKLSSIVIPESITTIGIGAFAGCCNLSAIRIPVSVNSIGQDAFSGCVELRSIEVCNEQAVIGEHAFRGCPVNPYISGNTNNGESRQAVSNQERKGNDKVQYSVDGEKIIRIPKNVVSFEIPDFVTGIMSNAFEDCCKLKAIRIPDTVKGMGKNAFRGCASLKTVSISNAMKSLAGGAFAECRSLETIDIPESVKSIGREAFSGCSSLHAITIPDSVTSIGKNCFSGCAALESVVIPNSVENLGRKAFSGCRKLRDLSVPGDNLLQITDLFEDCSSLTSITLIGEPLRISQCLFSGCKCLMSVNLPSSITDIDKHAFSGLTHLETITVNDENPHFKTIDGVLYNYDVTSVICVPQGKVSWNIPKTVERIDLEVLRGCNNLKSITVDSENKFFCVKDNILYNSYMSSLLFATKNIESANIPDSVKSISDWAFEGCSKLRSMSLLDSVQNIGKEAFAGCGNCSIDKTIEISWCDVVFYDYYLMIPTLYGTPHRIECHEMQSSMNSMRKRLDAILPKLRLHYYKTNQAEVLNKEVLNELITILQVKNNLNGIISNTCNVTDLIKTLPAEHTRIFIPRDMTPYIDFLFEKQAIDKYPIVPIREYNQGDEEDGALFTIMIEGQPNIVWENYNDSRSTFVFKCNDENYTDRRQLIFDYIMSENSNKRRFLHSNDCKSIFGEKPLIIIHNNFQSWATRLLGEDAKDEIDRVASKNDALLFEDNSIGFHLSNVKLQELLHSIVYMEYELDPYLHFYDDEMWDDDGDPVDFYYSGEKTLARSMSFRVSNKMIREVLVDYEPYNIEEVYYHLCEYIVENNGTEELDEVSGDIKMSIVLDGKTIYETTLLSPSS